MQPSVSGFGPESLRQLFHRKTVASELHRSAAARLLGLSKTEAAALACLMSAGRLTPGQLGELLGMTSGGMTGLIQRLVARGYAVKALNPADRRSIVVSLTPEAMVAMGACSQPLVADIDHLINSLRAEELDAVGRFLQVLVVIMERHAQQLAAEDRKPRTPRVASLPRAWA
jgi:DNA-binding MarR family transcriptional regulator